MLGVDVLAHPKTHRLEAQFLGTLLTDPAALTLIAGENLIRLGNVELDALAGQL